MKKMKKAYFIVTLPAGEFLTTATTTNGRKLDYLDTFDRAILYRYFEPGQVKINRLPATEGRRRARTSTLESFRSLQRFGSFR